MTRIKIDVPDKVIFETELTVRASDLNYGAHLGHDTVLTLAQEARIRLYNMLGFKDEISFDGPVGQVIADAAVQYKSEAFLGDVITVTIAVGDFHKYGFDMYYRLLHKSKGTEVARVKTGIVCFDYNTRKMAEVPQVLLSQLQGLTK